MASKSNTYGGIPANISSLVSSQFSKLLSEDKIKYAPGTSKTYTDDGFGMHFLLAPALAAKPILSANDPGRKKAVGPFVDPDPEFVVCKVGDNHTLEFSMYTAIDELLVLHTNEYEQQSSPLTSDDLAASWTMLQALNEDEKTRSEEDRKREWMVVYNCGVEAGSSQGHKHLQICPLPKADEFKFWPERAVEQYEGKGPHRVKDVPYVNYLEPLHNLEKDSVRDTLGSLYSKMLRKAKAPVYGAEPPAHNLAMTSRWMVVIPRRSQGLPRQGAGAQAILGWPWVRDDTEVSAWRDYGIAKYLALLGVPNDYDYEENHDKND